MHVQNILERLSWMWKEKKARKEQIYGKIVWRMNYRNNMIVWQYMDKERNKGWLEMAIRDEMGAVNREVAIKVQKG